MRSCSLLKSLRSAKNGRRGLPKSMSCRYQTIAYAVVDHAHDRHAVRRVAACAYPDGLSGPVSRQTFTYDARDRLLTAETSAMGAAQYYESYRYDALGNILSRKVDGATVTYAYGRPPAPSQPVTSTLPHRTYLPMVALDHDPTLSTIDQPFAVVATSAGFRAAYDRNGNMTLRVEISGTATITYVQAFDVENRLHAVTNTVSGAVTRFTYDGDGNRLLREHGGARVLYLGATEIAIAAGGERTVTTYYGAGGGRIAKRGGRSSSSSTATTATCGS